MLTGAGLACFVFFAAAVFSRAASFQGTGFLGDVSYSAAYGISADGLTAVGSAINNDGDLQSFRWTSSGGMVGLPYLPGDDVFFSEAKAVSGNGSVVVGEAYSSDGPLQAYRWTQGGGTVGIPYLGGTNYVYGSAAGVSADGSKVAGASSNAADGIQAFLWTEADGTLAIPFLSGGSSSEAYGISADGSTIVGYSDGDLGSRAFRWTESGGTEALPFSEGSASFARAASADGSTIVGEFYGGGDNFEAFRWTLEGGVETLASLDPEGGSYALAVSGDGLWVIGRSNDIAVIWDIDNNVYVLKDWLTINYGLDLTGWELCCGHSFSLDGKTLAGDGYNPDGDMEGWVAVIPEPLPCALLGCALVLLLIFHRRFSLNAH